MDNESTIMGYLHRKTIKRASVVLLKSLDKILANYIRIFEPMVIKSLKVSIYFSSMLFYNQKIGFLAIHSDK